jgi:hypothetical protein
MLDHLVISFRQCFFGGKGFSSLAGGRLLEVGICFMLAASGGFAQSLETNLPIAPNSASSALDEKSEHPWTFSASIYGYFVPDSRDYAQPTITADHGLLHLEARYNYEALETGSTWIGANFSGGEKLAWELTPMLGGVFGDKTGIAPGYKGSLSWWKLELYSEGEYFFEVGRSSSSFFYNWSELTLSLFEWCRFGLVTQRTRAYHTDREIQRGILLGVTWHRFDMATYLFNVDESKPTIVVGVRLSL